MRKLFYILIMLTGFSSCEKVIDVDLKDSEPRFVVDANLSNISSAKIKLSFTSNFYDSTERIPANGAEVILTDQYGRDFSFIEAEQGVYQNSTFKTDSNSLYSLLIRYESKEFTSNSYTPSNVQLDSINISRSEFSFGDEVFYKINCYFKDPVDEINYYRFKLRINDEQQLGFYVLDDSFVNGATVSYPFNGLELLSGDKIRVELQHINKKVFDYYYTLSRITGPDVNVIPGNPESNIEGGAIGVFNPSYGSVVEEIFQTK